MSRAASSKPIKPAGKTARAKPEAKLKARATTPAANPEKVARAAKVVAAKTVTPVEKVSKAKATKNGNKAKQTKPEPLRECFFTFPEADYARISELKTRALNAGRNVKKSELLRAGLALLAGMADGAFLQALEGLGKVRSE